MKSVQSVVFGLLLLSCMALAGSRHSHYDYDYGRRPSYEYESYRRPSSGSGSSSCSCNLSFNTEHEQEQYNRRIVHKFYEMAFGDLQFQRASDKYISPVEYIQHNPTVADGIPAFVAFAKESFKGAKPEKVDIRRSAADGDLVWLHVRSGTQAVIDIFRVRCGKIVEHWDVIQEIGNGPFANDHPFF